MAPNLQIALPLCLAVSSLLTATCSHHPYRLKLGVTLDQQVHDSATYSDDANDPSNTRTQPAAADQATAALNELLSQYLGGHSDQDPTSADDLRNIQQWIISLKWNILYDEVCYTVNRAVLDLRVRRVFRLLATKPGSTPRGRLLRSLIRRLFSLVQAQISTRGSAYRNAIQTTRQLNNQVAQEPLAWHSVEHLT
ncbi:hypothetical protein GQ54DRAFT_307289 [Martensiomyces pterosporus]|nr:hypothetical protein GQ54DRAFT_307289 [Martensiomyces pterosporus]